MKYSEFYKLIEAHGWTVKKGKGIISMYIPTSTISYPSDGIGTRKSPQEP